jgi:hypothetical protein
MFNFGLKTAWAEAIYLQIDSLVRMNGDVQPSPASSAPCAQVEGEDKLTHHRVMDGAGLGSDVAKIGFMPSLHCPEVSYQ